MIPGSILSPLILDIPRLPTKADEPNPRLSRDGNRQCEMMRTHANVEPDWFTPEAREAMLAFSQKRKPDFRQFD